MCTVLWKYNTLYFFLVSYDSVFFPRNQGFGSLQTLEPQFLEQFEPQFLKRLELPFLVNNEPPLLETMESRILEKMGTRRWILINFKIIGRESRSVQLLCLHLPGALCRSSYCTNSHFGPALLIKEIIGEIYLPVVFTTKGDERDEVHLSTCSDSATRRVWHFN